MSKTTGFFYHELCMFHDAGNRCIYDAAGLYYQPMRPYENPESKRRLKNLLEVSGMLKQLTCCEADPATDEDIRRYHTAEYIQHLQQQSNQGSGDAGNGAPFSRGAYDIARTSAGLAVAAVKKVAAGELKNAYCLTRPPGHHALPDSGFGFCLLGNIPIAVMAAQQDALVKKVAIIDWDVHHGNGTQTAFYNRSDVLTISIHQDNNFPVNSGAVTETGAGEGKGFNINIPLPAGSGTGAYKGAMEQIILPALDKFAPDLIIIACGFDSSAMDPLGRMMLNSSAYRDLTQALLNKAAQICNDKLVCIHEGGYSESYVPFCGLAVTEALSGYKTQVVDPMDKEISLWGQQELQPHQQMILDQIKATHSL